jgi:hypothetical protein
MSRCALSVHAGKHASLLDVLKPYHAWSGMTLIAMMQMRR